MRVVDRRRFDVNYLTGFVLQLNYHIFHVAYSLGDLMVCVQLYTIILFLNKKDPIGISSETGGKFALN